VRCTQTPNKDIQEETPWLVRSESTSGPPTPSSRAGGRRPVVVANSEGSRTTPSVVAFAANGEVLVGPARQEPSGDQRRPDHSFGQAGRWDRTGPSRSTARSTPPGDQRRVLMKLKRDAEAYSVRTSPTGDHDARLLQ